VRTAPAWGAAAAVLLALAPRAADAAACCMSTSAFGVGRLSIFEDAAVGLNVSGAPSLGRWTDEGEWRANSADYSEFEARANVWGVYRVLPWLQAGVRAGWVEAHARAADVQEWGGGPADLSASLRFEILEIGESMLPAVALLVGASAPLGRTADESQTNLGTDATTRGAWSLSAGLSVEKAIEPWFARVDASVLVPLPRTYLGATQRFGPGFDILAGGGMEPRQGLVLGIMLRYSSEGAWSLDDQEVPGTSAFDLGVGPSASWKITDDWTLQASAETNVFASKTGQNRFGRWSLAGGVRRGF